MNSFNTHLVPIFVCAFVLAGCGYFESESNLNNDFGTTMDNGLFPDSEYFDSKSYERTLRYIDTYSVFSTPDKNFAMTIHRDVFSLVSENYKSMNKRIKKELWWDVPGELIDNSIFRSLISEQNTNDKKYSRDFQPHLTLKRCSKMHEANSDKIKICLLLNERGFSKFENMELETEFFGFTNKIALGLADPFGNFYRESDMSKLESQITTKNEIEYGDLSEFIVLIRLKSFDSEALPAYLSGVINKKLITKGKTKLILDLRGNKGGLKHITAEIASIFLPEGAPFSIFRERDDSGKWKEPECETVEHFAEEYTYFNGPLVVLTDHGTASAGEVLVAALQANKRALVVGQETFGKGIGFLVGNLNELGYTSRGVMTLSTMILYHPLTEESWHLKSIKPDIALENIVSVRTAMDWNTEKEDTPYRMRLFKHVSNRNLPASVMAAKNSLDKCNYDLDANATAYWHDFIENREIQKEIINSAGDSSFEDDIPLFLAIKALEYIDPI